jgi:hypothetical protein
MKTLYMMHIPKTGGLAVRTLSEILYLNGVLSYPSSSSEPLDDFSKFGYIHGHFGIKPILDYPETEIACLVRDPLDRLVSNFIWLLMNNELQEKEPYSNLSTIYEKMRHYLFEDIEYSKNNLMVRFLSNPIDDDYFRINHVSIFREDGSLIKLDKEKMFKDYYKDWFIENKDSINVAKSYLDKVTILGTTDRHTDFMDKVFQWFIDNYNLNIKQEYEDANSKIILSKGIPNVNYSTYQDTDGMVYTTASLKELLTQEDIDQIYANNSLDLELYNYAKEKLQ